MLQIQQTQRDRAANQPPNTFQCRLVPVTFYRKQPTKMLLKEIFIFCGKNKRIYIESVRSIQYFTVFSHVLKVSLDNRRRRISVARILSGVHFFPQKS